MPPPPPKLAMSIVIFHCFQRNPSEEADRILTMSLAYALNVSVVLVLARERRFLFRGSHSRESPRPFGAPVASLANVRNMKWWRDRSANVLYRATVAPTIWTHPCHAPNEKHSAFHSREQSSKDALWKMGSARGRELRTHEAKTWRSDNVALPEWTTAQTGAAAIVLPLPLRSQSLSLALVSAWNPQCLEHGAVQIRIYVYL